MDKYPYELMLSPAEYNIFINNPEIKKSFLNILLKKYRLSNDAIQYQLRCNPQELNDWLVFDVRLCITIDEILEFKYDLFEQKLDRWITESLNSIINYKGD